MNLIAVKYHKVLAEYFHFQNYFQESIEDQRKRAKQLPPTPRPVNIRKVVELPWQRIQSQNWDEVENLFTNLLFLESKTEAGKLFDLVKDFDSAIKSISSDRPIHRILLLLKEALLRDIHFIMRHPNTLFQCLWNTCWWHDCPELPKHFHSGHIDIGTSQLLQDEHVPKLYMLLEQWQLEKKIRTPGFHWIRSLRPVVARLGRGWHATLQGQVSFSGCAIFSSDSKTLIAAFPDGSIQFWDVQIGMQSRSFHPAPIGITHMTISPDNLCLLVGTNDGSLALWEMNTGTELLNHRGLGGAIISTAVSPDARHIAWTSNDKSLRVCDVQTGEQNFCIKAVQNFCGKVSFSQDGLHLSCGLEDGSIREWESETGKELTRYHKPNIISGLVGISEDFMLAISSCHNEDLLIWKVKTGETICRIPCDGLRATQAIFSTDCSLVVALMDNGTIHLWNLETGKHLLRRHGQELYDLYLASIAFSPNGQWIASRDYSGAVRIWDTEIYGDENLVLNGHTDRIDCISFSPDYQWCVTGGLDGTLRQWDPETGEQSACLTREFDQRDVSTNEKLLAEFMGGPPSPGTADIINVTVSPNGDRIVSGSRDHTARVWSVRDKTEIMCLRGHTSFVWTVVYTPDGRYIATGSLDNTIRFWDVETGEMVKSFDTGSTVRCLACFPDSRRIASSGDDRRIDVWEWATADKLLYMDTPSEIRKLWCSPDGNEVAAELTSRAVRVWDGRTGALLMEMQNTDTLLVKWGVSPQIYWQVASQSVWEMNFYLQTNKRDIGWYPFSFSDFGVIQSSNLVFGIKGSDIHFLVIENADELVARTKNLEGPLISLIESEPASEKVNDLDEVDHSSEMNEKPADARNIVLHFEAKQFCMIAMELKSRRNLSGAIDALEQAKQKWEAAGEISDVLWCLANQSVLLQQLGQSDQALALHQQEETLCHALNDKAALKTSLGNQALAFAAKDDFRKALELHRREEYLCRELGNDNALQISLGNQATALIQLNNLDEAMHLLIEQEQICKKTNNIEGLHTSLGNQGIIQSRRGNFDQAFGLHQQQERIARKVGNPEGLVNALLNKAPFLVAKQKVQEAIEAASEAMRIAAEFNLEELRDKAELLLKTFRQARMPNSGVTRQTTLTIVSISLLILVLVVTIGAIVSSFRWPWISLIGIPVALIGVGFLVSNLLILAKVLAFIPCSDCGRQAIRFGKGKILCPHCSLKGRDSNKGDNSTRDQSSGR